MHTAALPPLASQVLETFSAATTKAASALLKLIKGPRACIPLQNFTHPLKHFFVFILKKIHSREHTSLPLPPLFCTAILWQREQTRAVLLVKNPDESLRQGSTHYVKDNTPHKTSMVYVPLSDAEMVFALFPLVFRVCFCLCIRADIRVSLSRNVCVRVCVPLSRVLSQKLCKRVSMRFGQTMQRWNRGCGRPKAKIKPLWTGVRCGRFTKTLKRVIYCVGWIVFGWIVFGCVQT